MSDLRTKLKDEKRKRIDAETKASMLEEALQQSPEQVSVDAIVIALENRRKQFEDTYVKESDNGNFMDADKAGFYEECYRNVIKDLKEEVQ